MLDSKALAGRRALVCGASKGIGRAAALSIAHLGADVTVLARSRGPLEELLPALRAAGASNARVAIADFDDPATIDAAIDEVLAAGPIHVLVHNTGGPPGGPLLKAEPGAILAALRRHLLSAHQLVQRLLPGMASGGYGRVITVTSTSVREPIDNLGVSNLTRAAVASWVKTLSRELPPGVTINNILPGYTATARLSSLIEGVAGRRGLEVDAVRAEWRGRVPEGRFAEPSELGAVIAFLACPAAAYVRGVSLPVDGGRLRSI